MNGDPGTESVIESLKDRLRGLEMKEGQKIISEGA